MLLPVGALIAAMASLTVGASIAKSLFPAIGPEGTTALRLLLSALLLTLFLKPWRTRFTATNWQAVAGYGASVAGMNLLFYMSLETIPLGIAIALEFSGPMAVAMIWSRRPIDFLWICMAIAGLLLLLPLSSSANALDLRGSLLALGAGACWAVYIVVGQKAGRDHGAQAPVLGLLIAAVLVFPIGFYHAGTGLFALALLPAALGVGILSGALPYTLEMFSMRRLPTHTFGTLLSLEPAIGAMTGFILLQEMLALQHIVAIAVIVGASIGATLTIGPKAPLHLPE